jgi:hypothetical protein
MSLNISWLQKKVGLRLGLGSRSSVMLQVVEGAKCDGHSGRGGR